MTRDHFRRQAVPRPRGFTLVVTISLLVLLTVIAVGLLSLSAVSLRSAGAAADMAVARANARLALVLAIGQLQEQLGPDQRVAAAAGLKHDEAGPLSRWTGVWRSWPEDTDERPEPEFLRWLASGDEALLAAEDTPSAGAPGGEPVTLVGEGTLGSAAAPTDRVVAPLLRGAGGGFAWWTGDEAAKACIPGAMPQPDSPARIRSELTAAGQTGIDRLAGCAAIDREDARLDKVITPATLGHLADAAAAPNPHFHDLTTGSLSLITNVRKGGFRKDLSIALEVDERRRPDQPLYMVDGKQGINLGELWDYYNVWREVDLSSRLLHPDGSRLPRDTPVLELDGAADETGIVEDPFYPYRRLTVLRNTWVLSLMTRRVEGGNNQQGDRLQLYLVLDPITTVWNPFDVAVAIDPSAYQGFKYWGIPYRFNLRFGRYRGTPTFEEIIRHDFVMFARYGKVEPIVLRPGEVQVVSQGTRDQTEVGQRNMAIDMRLGWNFGSGYRFPINGAIGQSGDRVACEMTPRSDGHMGVALTEFLHFQGNPQVPGQEEGKWLGGLMIDRNMDFGDRPLQATGAPDLYPTIPAAEIGSFTLGEITDRKRPIMMLSLDIKTERDPLDKGRFQGRFRLRHNPKLAAYDLQSFDPATVAAFPLAISIKALSSWKDPILDVGGAGHGYAGGDYTAQFGVQRIVTHSIPREPIHSLAAFQHAVGNGAAAYFPDHRKIKRYFLHPSISHAIGNSFAPSFLRLDSTRGTLNDSPACDHSWLANQALWDDWFLSSIAPRTSRSWQEAGEVAEQREAWARFLGTGGRDPEPLPNRRIKPWVEDPDAAVEEFFAGARPRSGAAERIGARLLIEGGFNVNSTSVEAWKALLSSTRGRPVSVIDPDAPGDEHPEFADGVPSAALLTPAGEAVPANLADPQEPLQWRGFRDLTDDQIDELAAALVEQVRLRGPFLSLADFVNRRLAYHDETAISGALQAALDDESVSINRDYNEGPRAITEAAAARAGLPTPEAEAGAAAADIPGYVKQADLLTTIGPQLTVRGDTFRVRAYGEARSKDGSRVLARAWCEATVQRIPEFLDPRDEAWQPLDKLASPVNRTFGRRFNLTGFRWLNPQEV